MFEIKGIRTFAMSAKDLDKSVEFYTKIVGGKDRQRPSNRRKSSSKPAK